MTSDTNILGQNLSPLQIRALRALLRERTFNDAAAATGVSRVTLWRWRKLPMFRQAFTDGKRVEIDTLYADVMTGRL